MQNHHIRSPAKTAF